ncbi:MAG: 23S rRNA (guanosine(2251)-2'-O)-methyltransferase RlmB [Deltaproteobacteria bacterium]|nr:23S rRNA (guanosine(2251)-2'-O)-methyltransferase RlmB [Deltaproteobacteria bacterium]MBW2192626.1 23S rRNA (guanosine(2251)-2'-O)-methyltransferase RlmB [Deltaproteobacteria bacterium]
MKIETLYGIHPVLEALRAGRRSFVKIYVSEGKTAKRVEEISAFARDLKIPVAKATTPQLKSMTGTDLHQGVGARVSPYAPLGLSDIVAKIESGKRDPCLLLLDNVVDPNNLGAIIRTALCAGVDGILIPRDRSAPPSPAVSKTSAGALEHAALARVTNMVNSIKTLKEKGLWIVGMDRVAEKSIFSVDFTGPVAIVVGGEEKGIRSLVKKHCDFLVSIPQQGRIDSLNASAAGAIVMYEAFRQREYQRSIV